MPAAGGNIMQVRSEPDRQLVGISPSAKARGLEEDSKTGVLMLALCKKRQLKQQRIDRACGIGLTHFGCYGTHVSVKSALARL